MVRIKPYRLKASILEPLIALMIIFFSITAAFFVVTNMREQINIKQTARAVALANRVLSESIKEENFLSEELEEEGLHMEKAIEWFDKENGLLYISINVYDNREKLIANRQKIIIADEAETE